MSSQQSNLGINLPQDETTVEGYKFELHPIRGFPEIRWSGKRPFTETQFYPAQLEEVHGLEVQGWRNKLYWGDNFQVMSHLLKTFRGKVKLVYIDPPFDSKADYRRKIQLAGRTKKSDQSAFEEKQYADIWNNDEYLQYMYERLILLRELLRDDGSIFLHCDFRRSHHLRCLLDEVFGPSNFINEIAWKHTVLGGAHGRALPKAHETILWYGKSPNYYFNADAKSARVPFGNYIQKTIRQDEEGRWYYTRGRMSREPSAEEALSNPFTRTYVDNPSAGTLASDLWSDKPAYRVYGDENTGYPTQKNESIVGRCVELGTNPGDIVMDCFMGSGTTQSVAMKLGRRFIGCDINLGAIQITTRRLILLIKDIEEIRAGAAEPQQQSLDTPADEAAEDDDQNGIESVALPTGQTVVYEGFEVYNVNNYDVFRNPVEAKDLLLDALEVQRFDRGNLFDGEKDGRIVKIMPVNRIATREDLNELIAGFDYKMFERRRLEHPNQPVEKITLICMGHEPDLAATLKNEIDPYAIDVQVVDILRDKQDLQFKRDSEAKIAIKDGHLIVEAFYPMNLLQKLSLQQENVNDWREMVESIMIDWNYDGVVLEPRTVDIPDKDELVAGRYAVPADAGTIRVKITDLLSESWEGEVQYG